MPGAGSRAAVAGAWGKAPSRLVEMKLEWVLFGLLLAMCLAVGAAFVIGHDATVVAEGGVSYPRAGFPHPLFPSMDAGGPPAPRHAPILWVAWSFAVLQTAFLVACLAFGARRRERVGRIGVALAAGGLVLVGIVTVMVASYGRFMAADSPELVLALPAPTAWYLYLFWPFEFFFVLVFVLAFRRSFVDADTMVRFHALLASRRACQEQPRAATDGTRNEGP